MPSRSTLRYAHTPAFAIGLFALCSAPTVPLALAQDTLDGLLGRLSEKPLDQRVLWKIEAQRTDPRTIPALEAAFAKRQIKREKQWIAVTLLRLGDKSADYFNYLAGYAKEAVEDRTPFFERFDQEGRPVRGQVSAELENWCALNHKDPKQVAGMQFAVYPTDVRALAQAEDRRAIQLFERGLDSPYPGVVAYSVQGLGRLNVVAAIPLISQAVERIPAGERGAIAMELPWYAGGDAEQLFERLIPSAPYRDHLRGRVQMQRDPELKRILSREGRAVPK